MIDEQSLMKTIIIGSDWEEVISNIVEEEGLDPWNIDIVKLVDMFVEYLYNLKRFDFRIPARFILIAAILLRMKCEIISKQEIKPKNEEIPQIDINVPLLDLPMIRKPTKPVSLDNLIDSLNKAIEFEDKKKTRKLQIRRAVENLIQPEEDIELRMKRVFSEIKNRNIERFSQLVSKWERNEIVDKFVPLLHLSNNGVIRCDQQELFGEIFINVNQNQVM